MVWQIIILHPSYEPPLWRKFYLNWGRRHDMDLNAMHLEESGKAFSLYDFKNKKRCLVLILKWISFGVQEGRVSD